MISTPSSEQVKQARKEAGLTQKDSAARVCVTLNTWQKWEAGTYPMSATAWKLWRMIIKHGEIET